MQRKLHGGGGSEAAFSLARLLRESGIRLVDFFEPLKSFIVFLRLGERYEEELKALEKQFVVVCILFQKYEKIFGELITCDESLRAAHSELHRIMAFGWNLFLVAHRTLSAQRDRARNAAFGAQTSCCRRRSI